MRIPKGGEVKKNLNFKLALSQNEKVFRLWAGSPEFKRYNLTYPLKSSPILDCYLYKEKIDNSARSYEQLLHGFAILNDQISELKALQEKDALADQELRRAKEYAEFIFKSIPSAIFTTDINRIITS
ncbi:MAG: hypothetical protein KAS13_05635 [Candidatus Omnitrophica bacterium]|nr:hypothetical protein [Candidatus Omnitrophota bacterium]